MNSGSSYYTACNKGHFNMFSSIDQPMGSEENNVKQFQVLYYSITLIIGKQYQHCKAIA
jgi:hypothetical protein